MNNLTLNVLGAQCQPVADGVIYASTSLAMPFYGRALGGYIQDLGNNRVRISDNADTLFEAITHGVKHSKDRELHIKELAKSFDMEFTDVGELAVVCSVDRVDYFFSRFLEASFALASNTLNWHPAHKKTGAFKREIGSILTREYKERLKKNVKVTGSSGHQLIFHFAIDSEMPEEQLIQTISSSNSSVDWSVVYGTLGKMIDVSRVSEAKRLVIIERADGEELASASTLLSTKATVIPFSNGSDLVNAINRVA